MVKIILGSYELVLTMDSTELEEYLAAQVEEINRYKWIESQKRNCDIGFQRAAIEWIALHAEEFRMLWFQKNGYKKDNTCN